MTTRRRAIKSTLAAMGAGMVATSPAVAATPAQPGPILLTVTGAVRRPNRGALDPALDQLMAKQQVQFMVKRLLNLKEAPALDASDALAIAMCHLHSSKRKVLCTTT